MKHNQEGLQNFYSKGAMPASSLEEKETRLMPMLVAKVPLLLVQRRRWKLYYHSPKETTFLFGIEENDSDR